MRILAVFITIGLLPLNSFCQSFLFTDIGNTILLRPNIGYEFHKKKHSLSGAIQWQSNSMYWISEFPQLKKTNGIRLDLAYKYFSKRPFFVESILRFQSYKASDVLYGWGIISLYNSKNIAEVALKIGLRSSRNKKRQTDFSVGIGANYSSMPQVINKEVRFNGNNILTDKEILLLYPNQFFKATNIVPHVQLRIYRKLNK